LPIVSIPTTYAGSEMTPIFGITTANQKQTGRDPRVLPKVAIYDPTLSRELPLEISIASGLNAMAHAVEGLYAQDGNPIASLMAEEAIGALALGMQTISRRRDDLAGRSQCLYGAWLSGVVLGNVGMALHHKLCHTLGGTFNLAHAQTHAVILPHAFAFNETAAPEASRRVRRALGDAGPSGAQALHRLEVALGAPLSLQALGLRASDLDRAAESAIQSPYPNPRAVEKTAVRALLDDAFFGRRPRDW
jgi:maleylacetate reductase